MFNLFAFAIVIAGAINWFCIGIFQFDVIAGIFGSQAHFVSRFVYGIIGLSGAYFLVAVAIKKGNLSLKGNACFKCPLKEDTPKAKGDKTKNKDKTPPTPTTDENATTTLLDSNPSVVIATTEEQDQTKISVDVVTPQPAKRNKSKNKKL